MDANPSCAAVPQVRAHGRPARLRRARDWAGARISAARDVVDAGMATAEYAMVTVAAAGFAGLLALILRSQEVRGLLTAIVRGALSQ